MLCQVSKRWLVSKRMLMLCSCGVIPGQTGYKSVDLQNKLPRLILVLFVQNILTKTVLFMLHYADAESIAIIQGNYCHNIGKYYRTDY